MLTRPTSQAAPVAPAPAPASRPVSATAQIQRRGYHHGDLRAALIEAGLEILETRGIDGLTLRGLATELGVSHTAPKNHFATIDGLRAALATEGFWRLGHELRRTAASKDADDARLIAVCEAYIRFAVNHSALYQLMVSPMLYAGEPRDLTEASAAAYNVLHETASRMQWPAGRRAVPENPDMPWMIWTMLHGHAHLSISAFRTGRSLDTALAGLRDILPPLRFTSPEEAEFSALREAMKRGEEAARRR